MKCSVGLKWDWYAILVHNTCSISLTLIRGSSIVYWIFCRPTFFSSKVLVCRKVVFLEWAVEILAVASLSVTHVLKDMREMGRAVQMLMKWVSSPDNGSWMTHDIDLRMKNLREWIISTLTLLFRYDLKIVWKKTKSNQIARLHFLRTQ